MFLELVVDYDRPRVANALEGKKDDTPSPPFEFELLTPLGALQVQERRAPTCSTAPTFAGSS